MKRLPRRALPAVVVLLLGASTVWAAPSGGEPITHLPQAAGINVTPSTNLLDGQTVTVTGSGFAPDAYLGVAACVDPPAPFGGCDSNNAKFLVTDPTGSFTIDITVRRVLYKDGAPVDCAIPGSCVITASTNAQNGVTAPIAFDGNAPLPPPPIMLVTPSTDLIDGQSVQVSGSGFDPGDSVGLVRCGAAIVAGTDCDYELMARATVDGSGHIDAPMVLDRLLYLGPVATDCAQPAACLIRAVVLSPEHVAAEAAIQFDPTVPLPPPPSITIDPATGLADGQLITVVGTGYPRQRNIAIMQCGTGASGQQDCDVATVGYAAPDPDGTFTFSLRVSRVIQVGPGQVDCAAAGACRVTAGTLANGNPSADAPIQFGADAVAEAVGVAPAFTG